MNGLRWATMVLALRFGVACGAAGEEMSGAQPGVGGAGGGTATSTASSGAGGGLDKPLCSLEGAATWTSSQVDSDGPHLAGHHTYTWIDPTRTTAANGVWSEKKSRTIVTKVWYPAKKGVLGDATPGLDAKLASGGPFPVVVHSHGFMSSKDEVEYLAKRLATRGYVVAAPEFPLTNLTTPGGARFVDLANQPRDVSFVIDQLEAHHGAADSLLFGAIDKKRIALSGTSLGGATTLLATYHPKLRDPRVVAAVSFAGLAAAFTDKMYAAGSARVLLLHGVIDALLDYQANAVAAHQRAAGRAGLITFATGTHTGFAGSAALLDSLTHNVDTVGCKAIASATPKPEEIVDLVKALGGADAGVQIPVMPPPCATNPLPDGMKPQRQAQLTMLAATSFFELHFASDAIARASACRFLTETLAKEQQGVTYAP